MMYNEDGDKMKIKILNMIKKEINNYKLDKQNYLLMKKNKVFDFVNRSLTEEEIESYNLQLIIDSAGWIGGDYSEYDIKACVLRHNKQYLTDEEYDQLDETINEQRKSGKLLKK